jgi:peptidoglycan/LPS O-acetylase OafA/YrhL
LKFLDSSGPRVPGLDLLRGIAIAWVMLFHFRFMFNLPKALFWPARYGWLGVDLFFVLSGYLIGSQLLRPYPRGGAPSLGGFYFRRAFRILPAYLAVLTLYFTVPLFREAPGLSPAWQFLTFTENFRINYAADQAFSHVWSLCVEEHFYLVLPLLVLLLMRKPRLGNALAVMLAILAFGILVSSYIYLHQLKPLLLAGDSSFYLRYIEKIYYPTYTRLDGLLMGVALASIKTFRPLWWQRLLSGGYSLLLLGLLCCGCALWLFRDRFGLPGTLVGFPLVSAGLALLLLASISPTLIESLRRLVPGALGNMIRQWLCAAFGLGATLAYSTYLTHKQIAHLLTVYGSDWMHRGGWPALATAFSTSLAAATVLYVLVERPFLLLRQRISEPGAAAAKSLAASQE